MKKNCVASKCDAYLDMLSFSEDSRHCCYCSSSACASSSCSYFIGELQPRGSLSPSIVALNYCYEECYSVQKTEGFINQPFDISMFSTGVVITRGICVENMLHSCCVHVREMIQNVNQSDNCLLTLRIKLNYYHQFREAANTTCSHTNPFRKWENSEHGSSSRGKPAPWRTRLAVMT